MASSNEASRSDSASETDDDSTEFLTVEDPMRIIMSLLSQSLPSSVTTLFHRAESDEDSLFNDSRSHDSHSYDSQSHDSQLDDSQPDDSQSYDSLFDDTPSESSTTKEHDETTNALEQEEQVDSTKFSQLINALIECQLNKSQANDQRPQGPRRDLFEEHMREEALILDNLAGPDATAAERKKVADDAAEVRQKLADQSIESVAESVARARRDRPRRAEGVERREADKYELELASMRRLVELALEESPGDAALGSLAVIQRMSLRPLRAVLHGHDFQRLKKDVGSFDDAVKCLFDMLWSQKKAMENMLKVEKKLAKEKGKGKAEE